MSFINPPSFIDRYFTRRYAVDVLNKPNEDICLLMHSNGICVLTLAPYHPVVRRSEPELVVKSVDFKVTQKLDRLDNKVSGKGKRGAQFLTPDSVICKINCGEKNDAIFTVRACVQGRLIEVNERLILEPELLMKNPETLGYICVIQLKRPFKAEGAIAVGIEREKSEDSVDKKAIKLIDKDAYSRLRSSDAPSSSS